MTDATKKHPKFRAPIARWCDRQGVNYGELAERIGVGQSTFSLYLSGDRGLSLTHALSLHLETGVPVEKLVRPSDLHVLRRFLASATEMAA